MPDHDGYPTEDELERIRTWPTTDVAGALDFVAELWNRDYGTATCDLMADEHGAVGAEPGERYLRLVTGGWSGNEDIIDAMNENAMQLWLLTWRLSARGGLHIFQYPPMEVTT